MAPSSSTTFTPVKITDLLLVKDRDICLSCSKNRIKENKFVVIDKFVSFDSKISSVVQYTSLPFENYSRYQACRPFWARFRFAFGLVQLASICFIFFLNMNESKSKAALN